jgi:transposase
MLATNPLRHPGGRQRWNTGKPKLQQKQGGFTDSCSEPKKVARTLRAHRDLILNYFRARKEFSSGVIEGLNNKAKVTMRKSYGFRTFRVTELALYHSLGKLPEPELTHRFL